MGIMHLESAYRRATSELTDFKNFLHDELFDAEFVSNMSGRHMQRLQDRVNAISNVVDDHVTTLLSGK